MSLTICPISMIHVSRVIGVIHAPHWLAPVSRLSPQKLPLSQSQDVSFEMFECFLKVAGGRSQEESGASVDGG